MGVVGRQNLDRHVTVKSGLVRLVHGCHPTLADLFDDLVLSQRLPDQILHGQPPSLFDPSLIVTRLAGTFNKKKGAGDVQLLIKYLSRQDANGSEKPIAGSEVICVTSFI